MCANSFYCCSFYASCVNYVPEPEDSILLKTTLRIFRKFDHQPEALNLAIQLNDVDLVKEIFMSSTGRQVICVWNSLLWDRCRKTCSLNNWYLTAASTCLPKTRKATPSRLAFLLGIDFVQKLIGLVNYFFLTLLQLLNFRDYFSWVSEESAKPSLHATVSDFFKFVCHSACVWPAALKLGCITKSNMLILCLVDGINILLFPLFEKWGLVRRILLADCCLSLLRSCKLDLSMIIQCYLFYVTVLCHLSFVTCSVSLVCNCSCLCSIVRRRNWFRSRWLSC